MVAPNEDIKAYIHCIDCGKDMPVCSVHHCRCHKCWNKWQNIKQALRMGINIKRYFIVNNKDKVEFRTYDDCKKIYTYNYIKVRYETDDGKVL
jgi:hypothetical protein